MAVGSPTTPAEVALVVAGAAALGNWWAVSTGHRRVEWVTKPLVMVALVVAAIALDPTDGTVRLLVVVGLVFSLAGDVLLMLPHERFVEGLASFLVAHLAYVAAFVLDLSSALGLAVGVVIALAASIAVGRPIVAAVRRDEPRLSVPVVAYMGVISAMFVAACGTLEGWTILGATAFFVSDGILATNKFVRPLPAGRFAVMATYHLAQASFVIALVR